MHVSEKIVHMKTGQDITMTFEKITPSRAAVILEANNNNRGIRPRHVMFLAQEMIDGKWVVNGDAIRFATDGVLLDGQHRLLAVVSSGCSIESYVIRGLDRGLVFPTIDIVAPRTAGDTLTTLGIKNGRNLSATLLVIDETMKGRTSYYPQKISNEEIIELHRIYAGAEDSLPISRRIKGLAPVSLVAGMHYVFSLVDSDKANRFFTIIADGIGDDRHDPAMMLRARLITNAIQKSKLPKRYLAALFIKAWNAFGQGKKLKTLRFTQEGDKAEPFPTIRG